MSDDKMRTEFEVWLNEFSDEADMEAIAKARGVQDGHSVYIFEDNDEATLIITAMWVAWQASRAALVIDLPETISVHNMDDSGFVSPAAEMYDDAIQDCRAAIEAAGVRVKK